MEQLRDWRKAKGISIEEAGSLIGVSGVQWHRLEAGTRRVASGKVALLSDVTGIPPHELRPDLADIFASTAKEPAA